jgi:hypothetical protein
VPEVVTTLLTLLRVMGVIELITGLGLLAAPSLLASLLLGSPLEGAVALVVARVCGAALFSLGIACLLSRDESAARASGLPIGMLLYNVGSTGVLAFAGFGLGLGGALLWLVVIVHAALAIWCVACLRVRTPLR